jgi:nucleotide-binding universal stress UspA family protein
VGGGEFKLLHVVSIMPTAHDIRAAVMMPTEEEVEKVKQSLKETAENLAPFAKTELVMATSIGHAVIDVSMKWPAELIVMGTHGRGAVGRMVFGSVADYVMRNASCPVVTMRAA